jgi:phosphatidylglycerol:prolipoprotein diacylglycerol transferase
MSPSPFSSRQALPGPGQRCAGTAFRFGFEFVRGNEVLWLGFSRPQWFLLVILLLLFWRMLRDSRNHSVQSLERRVA